MPHFEYLFSILLFCGPILMIIWRLQERILKKYELVLLIVVLLSLPFSLTEFYALKWGVWEYYPNHVFNVRFFAESETFVFSIAVTLLTASLTLIAAYFLIDRKTKKHDKKKSVKK